MCVAAACSSHERAIAELTQADGPVDREASGRSDWASAPLGVEFFLGDAARTAGGAAQLTVGGDARVAMQPHTILRFGGKPGESKLAVESGAIDLSGDGSFALDVGNVNLGKRGTVRITAQPQGPNTVELVLGEGSVATAGGQTIDLVVGKTVSVDPAQVPLDAAPPIDARAPDAPPLDAAPAPVAAAAGTIEISGKRAEIQAPGEATWTPLPPGKAPLAAGSKLRFGAGTVATVSTPSDVAVELPGGAIALKGIAGGPAEARLDPNARDTKVTVLRGGAKLTGAPGTELGMNRGESAALSRAGAIRVLEAIPNYFDFRVAAGESFTVHDAHPPTAVQFQLGGKCPDGGVIELDRDARFRTPKVSSGHEGANLMLATGAWSYRLRCTTGGSEGAAVASGRVSVLRDDGRRPLPKSPGVNDIAVDGRSWRISYQSAIPNLAVHAPGAGSAFVLHLASGGKEETFASSSSTIAVPGAKLHEGTYTYWVDRDGAKQDKITTLTIDFDQTAPQVYIESPVDRVPWSGDIDVRGAVIPGWIAAVDAVQIPLDRSRRFAAKVGIPPGNALAIKLSHPARGIHYYLRRPK